MTPPRIYTTLNAFGKDRRATVVFPSLPLTPSKGKPELAYVPSYATDIRVRIEQQRLLIRKRGGV